MESRSDVVVVSAFGRGIWLAQELARQGTTVTLVDVSEKLGHSEPEDWNGPFPLLKSNQFNEAQWKFLSEGTSLEEVENGFTFWLPTGPWELKGPLFNFLGEKIQVSSEVLRYLKDFHSFHDTDRKILRGKIERMTGRENWLAYFAYQIASCVYTSERIVLEDSIPLALFAPCFIRQTNQNTNDTKFKLLEKAGVRLFLNAKIEDLSVQSRVLDGIEIASERSGIITGKKFVWMLTGEETRRFNPRVLNAIYSDGVVESSWCWVRFLLKVGEGPERDVLPAAFAVAKDVHLPWTHANMSMVERTNKPGIFRAWMRVASGRRFQRSYMTEMSNDLIEELRKRIPATKIEVEQMPPEFHFGFEELGPPRHPVLLKQDVRRISRNKLHNVHYVCPEDGGGLDWGTRISVENRTLSIIQKERREETKNDHPLHPS